MTKDEAMKLALEALEQYTDVVTSVNDPNSWVTVVDAGKPAREAIAALREALANEALNKMAENARELGLDYEPSAGTQVSKVWWDGERLMAKRIPFVEFYKPVQYSDIVSDGGLDPRNNPPAQRTWVGLTEAEIKTSLPYSVTRDKGCFHAGALWADDKLKEKNT